MKKFLECIEYFAMMLACALVTYLFHIMDLSLEIKVSTIHFIFLFLICLNLKKIEEYKAETKKAKNACYALNAETLKEKGHDI